MIDKDIIVREKQNWNSSLEEAYKDLFEKEILNQPLDSKEYENRVSHLEFSHSLVQHGLELVFREFPKLMEDIDGISRFERYITSIRALFLKIEHGILFKLALSISGLSEVSNKVVEWSKQANNSLPIFYKFFKDCEKYLANYEQGKTLTQGKFGESLIPIYASLKTWKTEEDFNGFRQQFNNVATQFIQIYIEGPIQLYIIISENHFSIVLRSLLLERLSQKDQFADLALLNDHIKTIVKDSKTLDYSIELLKLTAKNYTKKWISKQDKMRLSHPTSYLKDKFVKNFESGVFNFQEV